MSVGQELLNTPFPEMVQKLAIAVAESQTKLDMNSTAVASYMAEQMITLPDLSEPSKTKTFSLVSMGFLPTFYAVQEAEIEVKMAITMAKTTEKSGSASAKGGWGPFAASVNASYSSRYGYSQEGASTLRVKLAPAEPPIILQTYMEALTDKMSADLRADLEEKEPATKPTKPS